MEFTQTKTKPFQRERRIRMDPVQTDTSNVHAR